MSFQICFTLSNLFYSVSWFSTLAACLQRTCNCKRSFISVTCLTSISSYYVEEIRFTYLGLSLANCGLSSFSHGNL